MKQLRRGDRVPGVLYGKGSSQPVEFQAVELGKVLHQSGSENALVNIEIEGDAASHLALVQDIQIDPLTDRILHVDLHEVRQDETLRAEVSVHAIGEPAGVKTGGGLLETLLHTLSVECLPKDLPDSIDVDVTQLGLDQSIHVSEIQVPAGVRLLNPPALPVFTVKPPKTGTEETAAAPVTEPEVIKEKKDKDKEAGGDKEKEKK